MVGHSKPKFHFVSFGSDEATRSFMKEIVKELGGYYHHNSMDTEVKIFIYNIYTYLRTYVVS